ncbi:MAG: N-acetyl-gamma-glutamyl-phosphate reductase [Planctomycetota bacterium]|nr:N-acetyl-gamma-glutamyl-phosphate reductase [Planctomycetota bacterium]
MKTVAILGASGYTGRELARLLATHPSLRLAGAFSARENDVPEAPELPCDARVEALDWSRIGACDGVFLCTPHAASAELARRVLALGPKVVDLSADFRLPDAGLYERVYEHRHGAPELLREAPYGLTELAREAVRIARLVANPGCYPTATLLALKPLVAAGLVDTARSIVVDAKSGVSGAGKNPSNRTHFGASHENFLAYGVGGHRHAPEIRLHAGVTDLVFVPHLLPVFRGILATIYVKPARGIDAARMRACLAETYAGERFVQVYDRGQPELNRVQMTNQCHIAVTQQEDTVILTSAIDNLVKGASGQALQNMNLVLGLDEAAGLV